MIISQDQLPHGTSPSKGGADVDGTLPAGSMGQQLHSSPVGKQSPAYGCDRVRHAYGCRISAWATPARIEPAERRKPVLPIRLQGPLRSDGEPMRNRAQAHRRCPDPSVRTLGMERTTASTSAESAWPTSPAVALDDSPLLCGRKAARKEPTDQHSPHSVYAIIAQEPL